MDDEIDMYVDMLLETVKKGFGLFLLARLANVGDFRRAAQQ